MSKETIGFTLKKYREMNHITVKDVAEKLKKSIKTIYAWENGLGQPDIKTLIELCRMYNIDDFEVFSDKPSLDKKSLMLYPEQKKLLQIYNRLDTHGKKVINDLIQSELERIEDEEEKHQEEKDNKKVIPLDSHVARDEDIIDEMISIEFYDSKAAAGTGSFLTDNCKTNVQIPMSKFISEADFGVVVSGDSMEPVLFDGDLLLVKHQPIINHGDLGVFIINNQGFVKRFYNKNGVCKLISLNIDYEDIIFTEGDEVECVGKVLDKVDAGEWLEDISC